jgi:uridine kinase
MNLFRGPIEPFLSLNSNKPQNIIAVCGAADLGKSYLCQQWVAELAKQGIAAPHLTLDSYLIPRIERTALGISGYDLVAYDLETAKSDLLAWRSGKSIPYREYNHQTGVTEESTRTIEPCSFLFFDGLHVMHEHFKSIPDYSVFIYTSDEQLVKIRQEADLNKRKQTVEFSLKNSLPEFEKYKQNIEPYKSKADQVLELTECWRYRTKEAE